MRVVLCFFSISFYFEFCVTQLPLSSGFFMVGTDFLLDPLAIFTLAMLRMPVLDFSGTSLFQYCRNPFVALHLPLNFCNIWCARFFFSLDNKL